MKIFKKAVALLLCVAFIFTLAACHGKDEVAISSGDYKITSAMYSYYLVIADGEAKKKVDESADTKAEGFSYYKQTIDGKKFEDYVKDLALEKCLYHITLQKLADETGVKLDDEATKGYKSTAEYYWNYGYSTVMLENGVAFSTYEKIMLNDALYALLFEDKYGEKGKEAISDKDIASALSDNYAGVYMLSIDYSDDEKADTAKLKEELKTYQERLDKGEDFAKVKADFDAAQKAKEEAEKNNSSSTGSSSKTDSTSSTGSSSKTDSTSSAESSSKTDSTSSTESSSKNDSSSDKSSSTTTSSEEKEEEPKPEDANISVLTSYEDTYSGAATYFEKFANVKKLEQDKTEIIDDGENKVMYLVMKKDVTKDKYYLDELTDEIRYLLKGDTFDKFLEDYSSKLEYTVNDYAIGQFKVKKIYDGTKA